MYPMLENTLCLMVFKQSLEKRFPPVPYPWMETGQCCQKYTRMSGVVRFSFWYVKRGNFC